MPSSSRGSCWSVMTPPSGSPQASHVIGPQVPSDVSPLLLRQPSPDARVLAGEQSPRQALGLHRAEPADGLGPSDPLEGGPVRSHREEQLWILARAPRPSDPLHARQLDDS